MDSGQGACLHDPLTYALGRVVFATSTLDLTLRRVCCAITGNPDDAVMAARKMTGELIKACRKALSALSDDERVHLVELKRASRQLRVQRGTA